MKLIGAIQKSEMKTGFIENERSKKKEESEFLPIKIQKYHRFTTGSVTGSKLFVFPRLTVDPIDRNRKIREIVVSQYPPVFWNNIFRLKFWLKDEPGISREIFSFLKELNINIENQESIMTQSNSIFTISIIANFDDFVSERIENLSQEKKKQLNESLDAKKAWLRDLFEKAFRQRFEDNDKINVANKQPTLKSIELLNVNAKGYHEDNLVSEKELKRYFSNRYYRKTGIKNGNINLDIRLLECIGVNIDKPVFFTISSDSEEKYILIRFLDDRFVGQWAIEHDSTETGTLASFLDEIINVNNKKDPKENLNILSSFNRIEDYNEKAHWIVMMDCTHAKGDVIKFIKSIDGIRETSIHPLSFTDNLLGYLQKTHNEYQGFTVDLKNYPNVKPDSDIDNSPSEQNKEDNQPVINVNNYNNNYNTNEVTITNNNNSKISIELKELGVHEDELISELINIINIHKPGTQERTSGIMDWLSKMTATAAAHTISKDLLPFLFNLM